MTWTDTHCHIHEDRYEDKNGAYTRAMEGGVERLICVGTDEKSSQQAVEFARNHENIWVSLGLHPHDTAAATNIVETFTKLIEKDKKDHVDKIVAIGECGLDYFYNHSPREKQIELLHIQLSLARKYDLPVIFHVREGFDDFWPIFEQYKGLRGVLHSYTDNLTNLDKALSHGLYIGVNGIATFAKDRTDVYKAIPLVALLLETDAPFLTPVPHRGMVNEPAFVTHIAHYIANLQSISLEELSRATERNATKLFFSNK